MSIFWENSMMVKRNMMITLRSDVQCDVCLSSGLVLSNLAGRGCWWTNFSLCPGANVTKEPWFPFHPRRLRSSWPPLWNSKNWIAHDCAVDRLAELLSRAQPIPAREFSDCLVQSLSRKRSRRPDGRSSWRFSRNTHFTAKHSRQFEMFFSNFFLAGKKHEEEKEKSIGLGRGHEELKISDEVRVLALCLSLTALSQCDTCFFFRGKWLINHKSYVLVLCNLELNLSLEFLFNLWHFHSSKSWHGKKSTTENKWKSRIWGTTEDIFLPSFLNCLSLPCADRRGLEASLGLRPQHVFRPGCIHVKPERWVFVWSALRLQQHQEVSGKSQLGSGGRPGQSSSRWFWCSLKSDGSRSGCSSSRLEIGMTPPRIPLTRSKSGLREMFPNQMQYGYSYNLFTDRLVDFLKMFISQKKVRHAGWQPLLAFRTEQSSGSLKLGRRCERRRRRIVSDASH